MSVVLFNAFQLVDDTFSPSQPFLSKGERLIIDFTIVVSGGATSVRWYPEFLADPEVNPNAATAAWFREVAENTQSTGVVNMPKSIRVFQENGNTALANGTHRLTVQLVRGNGLFRLQAEQVSGGGSALITAIERNGLPAHSS